MNRSLDDSPLMLSVSGARGIVGRSMTPSVAVDLAAAFGSFVGQRTGEAHPTICVGRDSRPSGQMLANSVAAGLASVGGRVIDLGVVGTPTVGVMIAAHRASGGMIVTASHNPVQWNGLKFLDADGAAPPPAEINRIIRRFEQQDFRPAESLIDEPVKRDESGDDTHVGLVLANIDPEPIRAANSKIVLDSVNGAGCVAGRMLLEQLGCEVVHLNGEPTGLFAHTPEPLKENLVELAKTTATAQAACGFAQDPDADRLAIVDERGAYIGEEYTLVLAAKRVLELQGGGVIATNLSTSRMIDDVAAQYQGASVVRSAVGEANVVAAMRSEDAVIGGEGNGGVIFPPVCFVRDSLSAMMLVLSLLAAEKRPLSDIVSELPHYEMIKQKFDLSAVGGRDAVGSMIQKVTEAFADEKINTSDGVRVDFTEGWVHLRPSNTEPIVRLIAEAQTQEAAAGLMHKVGSVAGLG